MKNQFNKTIAKQVAHKSFDYMLGGLLGYNDPDIKLETKGEDLEQDFTEDLEERDIVVTPKRIKVVADKYDELVAKLSASMEKHFEKQTNPKS